MVESEGRILPPRQTYDIARERASLPSGEELSTLAQGSVAPQWRGTLDTSSGGLGRTVHGRAGGRVARSQPTSPPAVRRWVVTTGVVGSAGAWLAAIALGNSPRSSGRWDVTSSAIGSAGAWRAAIALSRPPQASGRWGVTSGARTTLQWRRNMCRKCLTCKSSTSSAQPTAAPAACGSEKCVVSACHVRQAGVDAQHTVPSAQSAPRTLSTAK